MGYTHYWQFKNNPKNIKDGSEKFKKAVKFFKKCMKKFPFELAGGDGTGKPIITDTKICFNGVGEDSYETCYFALDGADYGIDFCKTARNNYDAAVCVAILCFAKYFGEDFSYSSDGNDEDDGWKLAHSILKD